MAGFVAGLCVSAFTLFFREENERVSLVADLISTAREPPGASSQDNMGCITEQQARDYKLQVSHFERR